MKLLRASLIGLAVIVNGARGVQAITLYATDTAALYRVDTSTFVVTPVGNYTLAPTDIFIGGLCFDHTGQMWGLGAGYAAHLYELDYLTAATADVGALNVDFVFEGGLAFDPTTGVLYGVNRGASDNPNLMTINTATGQATSVGPIAFQPACGECHDLGGLAFDDAGQLYAVDRVTNALWTIDKTSPSSSGTHQVGPSFGGGIVMGPTGGMTRDAANQVTYCYASGSGHLFTVDLFTGAPTVLHAFGPGDPVFYSLAYRGEFATGARKTSWGSIKTLYR